MVGNARRQRKKEQDAQELQVQMVIAGNIVNVIQKIPSLHCKLK
jgi:hypothetical protein